MSSLSCSEHKEKLFRWPKNGDDVRGIYEVIQNYTENDLFIVTLAYISIYVK